MISADKGWITKHNATSTNRNTNHNKIPIHNSNAYQHIDQDERWRELKSQSYCAHTGFREDKKNFHSSSNFTTMRQLSKHVWCVQDC